MTSIIPTDEVLATVRRMQARLGAVSTPTVVELLEIYRELALRFERELASSPRDVALAKASALMLVQEYARARNAL